MARYSDPVCRICRREGLKLFLKGSRCFTKKCSFERRSTPPGMYAQRRRKQSEFGIQMREKQKVRRSYSIMERQFRNYFERAARHPGVTGEYLLRLLEMRLDNVIYRMGLARSRAEARQLVTHGHFTVNGRPTNIPSFGTKVGDRIEVREPSRRREHFKAAPDYIRAAQVPAWVSIDPGALRGAVLAEPSREQMPAEFNEQLVVEYYSR